MSWFNGGKDSVAMAGLVKFKYISCPGLTIKYYDTKGSWYRFKYISCPGLTKCFF